MTAEMKVLCLILALMETRIGGIESCRTHSDCGTGYCNGGTLFAAGTCIEKRRPGQQCIKNEANALMCDDDSCEFSFSACGNCGPVPNEYACSQSNDCQSRTCSGVITSNCNGICRETTAVNGQWGQWTNYGTCTATCGGGLQIRSRSCDNPLPSNGGVNCPGENHETRTCNVIICPVNGHWGEWSNFGSCSTTCGTSIKQRSRSCNNPPPSNGGLNCDGSNQESQSCNVVGCPVTGNWGQWTNYGTCTATCAGGLQVRSRYCNNPPPSNGGVNCAGENRETRTCNERTCPVNGNWGEWSVFGSCSTTCGTSIKQRIRSCDNPEPSNGGSNCDGSNRESQTCNVVRCPGTLDYKFYTGALSWTDAERECGRWGGHLATVDSQIQNDYFVSGMRVRNMVSGWIGLNDNSREGTFTWIGATTNGGYTNWFMYEPNGSTRDNCVEIIPGRKYNRNDWRGKWNDASCTSTSPFICERPKVTTASSLVRFPNPIHGQLSGRSYVQGHVEVFHNNQWGTICDDRFGNNDATVLCKMAGYGYGVYSTAYKQTSGTKATQIWLSNLQCRGSETSIDACTHTGWGVHSCNHNEDVGIRCYRGQRPAQGGQGISRTATVSISITGPIAGLIVCVCFWYCWCKKFS